MSTDIEGARPVAPSQVDDNGASALKWVLGLGILGAVGSVGVLAWLSYKAAPYAVPVVLGAKRPDLLDDFRAVQNARASGNTAQVSDAVAAAMRKIMAEKVAPAAQPA